LLPRHLGPLSIPKTECSPTIEDALVASLEIRIISETIMKLESDAIRKWTGQAELHRSKFTVEDIDFVSSQQPCCVVKYEARLVQRMPGECTP
jgi:hypothetical protein